MSHVSESLKLNRTEPESSSWSWTGSLSQQAWVSSLRLQGLSWSNVKFIEDLRGFLQAALRVLSSKRRFEGSGETGERASSYRHRPVWTSGVLNGLTVTGFGWGNSDPKLVWSRVERQMLTRAKSCLPSYSIPFPDSHLQLSSLPSKLRFGFRTTSCTKNMFKFGADLYLLALRHELISCHRSGDLVIFWIKGHPIFFGLAIPFLWNTSFLPYYLPYQPSQCHGQNSWIRYNHSPFSTP